MKDFLNKVLFSTRLTALLFVSFATAMAFGTFIESWYSTDTAKIWIYSFLLVVCLYSYVHKDWHLYGNDELVLLGVLPRVID